MWPGSQATPNHVGLGAREVIGVGAVWGHSPEKLLDFGVLHYACEQLAIAPLPGFNMLGYKALTHNNT